MMHSHAAKGVFCVAILILLVIVLDYYLSRSVLPVHAPSNPNKFKQDDVHVAKVVFASRKLTPSQRNVFFIETTCNDVQRRGNGLKLNSRQACAIYSTAFHNPHKDVTLVTTCPLHDNYYEESSEAIKALFDLPNFAVTQVTLSQFFEKTPFAVFLNEKLAQSTHPVEHSADLLRVLVVYLFGGTYMDLDFISLKPLDDLKDNFIGAQDDELLGNGAFNFEPYHPYLKDIMMESFERYDPTAWGSVGPDLATSVFRKFCNISDDTKLLGGLSGLPCQITLLSYKVFYPIYYPAWNRLFTDDMDAVKAELNDTYALHFWNYMSSNEPVVVGSEQPYAKMAEENCAPVYARSGANFR